MEGYDVVVSGKIRFFGNSDLLITLTWITHWEQLIASFYGHPAFLVAMVLMIAAIFVPVFAQSLPVLTFGEVLCGIPWGES
jgi:hypothetical protein